MTQARTGFPTAPGTRLRLADRFGAAGSLMCAVHCALWPLLIAAVPTLGLSLAGEASFERGFTVFATLLAVATLAWGYRRHRTHAALLLLVPGLAAVWFGAFGPLGHQGAAHSIVMAFGGLLVGAAHLLNIRLAARAHADGCDHHHHHHH